MNNKKIIQLIVCLVIVASVLCALLFAGNESGTNTEAEQHFQKANELHINADYDAAITEYEAVIKLSPNSKIAQNAQYWIGQLYFEARQFETALSSFQKLLDNYPASTIIPSTRTMIERVQQAKKNRALFEAVKKADFEQVKSFITAGADIDAKWGDTCTKEEQEKAKAKEVEKTALCCAVDSNNIDLVKLLVEAGADINVKAGDYWTPLILAVDESRTAIVEYLIDHGAKVNYPEDYGPLQYVINNIEMVELLIARGADVNYSRGGWPAIIQTIYDERIDIMELLIRHGADVNIIDKKGYSPLYHVVIMYDPNKDLYMEMMKLLITNGADVNYKNSRGETALWLAACYDTKVVQLLLEAGADINTKDNSGRTALHNAVQRNNDVVELLLTNGADINAKDTQDGYTALHIAAKFGKTDIIELLIDRGADINAKDNDGHTPLYIAVNNDYKVAELLINKGADSAIKTESGQTLGQLAEQRKKAELPVMPDMIFNGEPNSYFGSTIVCGDVDGDGYDDMLIGAYQYSNYQGRVYLFYGGPDIDTTADLIFEGQNEGDWFGNGIVCGDIDNDGHNDIIIAAGCYNKRQGCAYLYWGSDRNSMDTNADKIFTENAVKDSQFGASEPAIYDIDNDGYGDIILSASHPGTKRDRAGRAYLYYGNTKELLDTSYDLILTGENPGDFFGYTISCGDVDNDDYGDIVIGSSRPTDGRVYLYYGNSKSSMDAKADVIFEGKSEGNDYFGENIVCFDQNRDGFDDIVIGARSSGDAGHAYLFHGNSKNDMGTDPDIIFESEIERSLYGGSVVYGDIDGDNVNDIVIAEPRWRMGVSIVGRVYVYWGSELAGHNPKPGRIFTGENVNDRFSFGLACGDINNDGFDDLVIGADGHKAGTKQGRAYLYYGRPRKK